MTITAKELDRIINHMNEDHGDALVLYAHAFANRVDVESAVMVDLTKDNIVLALPDGEHLPVPLTQPAHSAKDAHHILVAMAQQGRKILEKNKN